MKYHPLCEKFSDELHKAYFVSHIPFNTVNVEALFIQTLKNMNLLHLISDGAMRTALSFIKMATTIELKNVQEVVIVLSTAFLMCDDM